jgi:hypothetical protein
MEVLMFMLDATHIVTSESMLLRGNNSATTVSKTPGFNSAAANIVIISTLAANISPI